MNKDKLPKDTLLLVDDEYQILKVYSAYLKDLDIDIKKAQTRDEAIAIIKNHKIALVLLDVYIKHDSGLELIPEIKRLSPTTKIIVVSGMSRISDAVEAMKIGAVDYLSKPVKRTNLISIVNKIMSQQRRHIASGKPFIGESKVMMEIFKQIALISTTNLNVLILGKSGTGKEGVAQRIHDGSDRKNGPFIAVDCGAIPDNLIENELFGSVKGSYTGALGQKGKFELADGGTLFLDEITNLPYSSQSKLLRVIQERTFYQIGGTKPISVDCRIIATSNIPFDELINEGKFREDLFYRLNEFFIELPNLRDRGEDILLLAEHFIQLSNIELNKNVLGLSEDIQQILLDYEWPGNVRELKHIIRTAVLYCCKDYIEPEHLTTKLSTKKKELNIAENRSFTDIIKETERRIIIQALNQSNWNKSDAAKILQMHRKTLYRKMDDLNIQDMGKNDTSET